MCLNVLTLIDCMTKEKKPSWLTKYLFDEQLLSVSYVQRIAGAVRKQDRFGVFGVSICISKEVVGDTPEPVFEGDQSNCIEEFRNLAELHSQIQSHQRSIKLSEMQTWTTVTSL